MNNPRFARIAAVAVPVLIAVVLIVLSVVQLRRASRLQDEITVTDASVRAVEAAIASIERSGPLTKFPAAEFGPTESSGFVADLGRSAAAAHVSLDTYQNVPVTPVVSNPGDPQGARTALPPEVTQVDTAMEVSGTYESIRAFLYDLRRADRLYNTGMFRWTRSEKYPRVALSFTISRYLVPPGRNGKIYAVQSTPPPAGTQLNRAGGPGVPGVHSGPPAHPAPIGPTPAHPASAAPAPGAPR